MDLLESSRHSGDLILAVNEFDDKQRRSVFKQSTTVSGLMEPKFSLLSVPLDAFRMMPCRFVSYTILVWPKVVLTKLAFLGRWVSANRLTYLAVMDMIELHGGFIDNPETTAAQWEGAECLS